MSEENVAQANEEKEVVEFTFGKMEQYFDAAKEVLEKYGGDVVDLGLNVLRIEALSEIFFPMLVVVLFFSTIKLYKNSFGFIKKKYAESPHALWEMLYFPWAIWGIMAFICLLCLFNLWAWVGIVYPELYAVHRFVLN